MTSRGAYAEFNFLVDLDDDAAAGPHGGFQEVSGVASTPEAVAHRHGSHQPSTARKIPGVHKTGDVTLKRGLIRARTLDRWLDETRTGEGRVRRTVTIRLQNEEHTGALLTWRLLRARIIKHTSGPLNAAGTDVPIEELGLAYEGLEAGDSY
jgi:phage tail-like protein